MKKHILFVISSMMLGGAQRVAANLIDQWHAQQMKVTVVVTYRHKGENAYNLPDSVKLIYLTDLAPAGAGGISRTLRRIFVFRRLLKQLSPDYIVSFMVDANIATLLSAWGLDLGVVVSERSYPPSEAAVLPRHYLGLRRILYPSARKIVLQSAKSLDWLNETIPSARGEVIFNPISLPLPVHEPHVDPDVFCPQGQRLIFTAGRLVDTKQFDLLISAFALIADRLPDWVLVIAGEGVERTNLLAQIDQLGLQARVHLPGPIGNIGDWYERAEVFALSSSYEGFPNVLLEAMAYGCACVALDCDTGPSDIIAHDENGLLLPATADAATIANTILSLAEDDELRLRLSQEALHVKERFSLPTIMRQWNALLFSSSEDRHGK